MTIGLSLQDSGKSSRRPFTVYCVLWREVDTPLWDYYSQSNHPLGVPQDINLYLPGGSRHDGGTIFNLKSAIVTPGPDPKVGSLLNQVYQGNYSARINNWDNMNHVSAISQTVKNYTDPDIYFSWAAVLEESHVLNDSDYFALKLTDDTTATVLKSIGYRSASAPGIFKQFGSWYYTDWTLEHLDVSLLSGHDYTESDWLRLPL